MWQLLQGIFLLTLLNEALMCIPTTTTVVCCPLLSTISLPKRSPSNPAVVDQCSVLRRVSSTCPINGLVFCDAAPQTNPTSMQVEFFNANGNVVRRVIAAGPSLHVIVYCVDGVYNVRASATSSTNIPIASVSCAQIGSVGSDVGFVLGSATN